MRRSYADGGHGGNGDGGYGGNGDGGYGGNGDGGYGGNGDGGYGGNGNEGDGGNGNEGDGGNRVHRRNGETETSRATTNVGWCGRARNACLTAGYASRRPHAACG